MGCPLIATPIGGLKEIVVDNDGQEYALIIPSHSSDAINVALKQLREYPEDRAELTKLGLRRVLAFDWGRIANQTVEVYRSAIEPSQEVAVCL